MQGTEVFNPVSGQRLLKLIVEQSRKQIPRHKIRAGLNPNGPEIGFDSAYFSSDSS
jgi:hypothetical protein